MVNVRVFDLSPKKKKNVRVFDWTLSDSQVDKQNLTFI